MPKKDKFASMRLTNPIIYQFGTQNYMNIYRFDFREMKSKIKKEIQLKKLNL